jgi:ABC-type Fe3+/spermidine/putrescine transport system ATPase subunit
MPPSIELEVRELTKRYSPQVSVGPISFEVQEGEFFSLLGPSGCGKTTTLRCIAGFEALTKGSISLHGERLDDKPPHRRDVGLVFQNYALFPHLTVFDNVAFGLRLRRLGKAEIAGRVSRVLQLVDLAGMAARFPAQLSGGQQQRVAIARSLVLEPRILMFDEPLSNLDFKLRIQMREELRNLQRRLGKTSIYVTHDSVFVAEFIGSSNMLRGRVVERGEAGTIVATETGLRLHCRAEPQGEVETTEVSILLRPECIYIGAPGGSTMPGQNRIFARIADVTYLGEDLHLSLELAGGERLCASVKNANAARGWAPTQSVELVVDAADLRLLSR